MMNQDQLNEFLHNQGIEEEVGEARAKNSEQQFVAASSIAAPFLTDAGRIALNELRVRTTQMACITPDEAKAMGFSNYEYGLYREGQNSIVRYIETCIAVAMQGPLHRVQPKPQPTMPTPEPHKAKPKRR